jgi:hypothetical protein
MRVSPAAGVRSNPALLKRTVTLRRCAALDGRREFVDEAVDPLSRIIDEMVARRHRNTRLLSATPALARFQPARRRWRPVPRASRTTVPT